MTQSKISSLTFENACKNFSQVNSNVEKEVKIICYYMTDTDRNENEFQDIFTKYGILEKLIETHNYISQLNDVEKVLLYNIMATTVDIDDKFANTIINHDLCPKLVDGILQDSIFSRALTVLIHNIARYPGNEYLFKNTFLKKKIHKEIKSTPTKSSLISVLLLLNVLDETEYIWLKNERIYIQLFLKYSNKAYRNPKHRYRGFCLWELLNALRHVSFSRHLKLFLNLDKLIVLIKDIFISYKHIKEIEMSTWILSNLCFDDIIKRKLVTAFDFQTLMVKYENHTPLLTTLFHHIKWQIGFTKMPEIVSNENLKFDIFISYSTHDEELIKPLVNILEKENLTIYRNNDELTKFESMLDGINKSKLLLAFISQNFLLNMNCRCNIKFAYEIKKPIAGILTIEKFPTQSWLELYVDDAQLYKSTGNVANENFDSFLFEIRQRVSHDKNSNLISMNGNTVSYKFHKTIGKSSKKVNFTDKFEYSHVIEQFQCDYKYDKNKRSKSLPQTGSSEHFVKPKYIENLDELLHSINNNRSIKEVGNQRSTQNMFKSCNKSAFMMKTVQNKLLKRVNNVIDLLNKNAFQDKQLTSTISNALESLGSDEMINGISYAESVESTSKIETIEVFKPVVSIASMEPNQPIQYIPFKKNYIRLGKKDAVPNLSIQKYSDDSMNDLEVTANTSEDKFTSKVIPSIASSKSNDLDISAYSALIKPLKLSNIGNLDENKIKTWFSEKNLMNVYNKMQGFNGSLFETLIQQYKMGLRNFRKILKPYGIQIIDCDKFYGEIIKLERFKK